VRRGGAEYISRPPFTCGWRGTRCGRVATGAVLCASRFRSGVGRGRSGNARSGRHRRLCKQPGSPAISICRLPHRGPTSRSRQSSTAVLAPYRCGHLGGIRLDLVLTRLVPHDEPHARRSRVAQRHRRARFGFHRRRPAINTVSASIAAITASVWQGPRRRDRASASGAWKRCSRTTKA
jgi:hypothetical protein